MMHNVTELFREIEPDLKGKTVTYIPTAGIAEEIEGMIEDETNTLESLGLTVDVLDVSTATYDSIVSTLTKNDIINTHSYNPYATIPCSTRISDLIENFKQLTAMHKPTKVCHRRCN